MPVKEYEGLAEAYQALTDIEIVNDEKNYPVARIHIKGIHTIEISMLSEYHYWYVLEPLREKILNFYINYLAQEKDIKEGADLLNNLKSVYNQIESCLDSKDVLNKAQEMSAIFKHGDIRKMFFKGLKKMGIVKWWVGWKKWQMTVKPPETLCIFIFLWLFNFDGVKKNVSCLLTKIGAVMNDHLSTGLSYSENWDEFKQKIADGEKRVREKLSDSLKN